MLTMEELWRGKEAGGKENLADFWLMDSGKERSQPTIGGPLPQRSFYINFGVAKETGPQGAGGGKTQAIAGAAVMGTDGGDKSQFSLKAG